MNEGATGKGFSGAMQASIDSLAKAAASLDLGLPLSIEPIEDPKIVMVVWHDSRLPSSRWRLIEDMDCEIVTVQSVGFLVYRSEDLIVLAPNVGSDPPQISGEITIPVRCITEIFVLRKDVTSTFS